MLDFADRTGSSIFMEVWPQIEWSVFVGLYTNNFGTSKIDNSIVPKLGTICAQQESQAGNFSGVSRTRQVLLLIDISDWIG